ncbi:MAG: hypothetical protein JXQ72_02980 [Anaerolineae bacterium]|nr:hypothetical protein [Anaerolineae bacterium]
MIGILLFLVLLLIGTAALTLLFLGWSYLLGWLVIQVVSFSQFESTLLAMIATGIVVYILFSFFRSPLPITRIDDDEEDELFPEGAIPRDRFYKEDQDKTWEAWFHFIAANSIYAEFEVNNLKSETLGEEQLKEIAVRLAEVGSSVLKSRTGQSPRHRSVTTASLKQQMNRMKLKPYDDDIMDAATIGINIATHAPMMDTVIHTRLWDKPTGFFDVED